MSSRWVCLMYHDVCAERTQMTGGSSFFSVSVDSFARQLAILRDAGLQGSSIGAVLADGGARRIAISFDDGNEGQATRAFPTLVANDMTATFFVTTAWVGRPGFATWDQLREMRDAGMAIESHTHTHPFLSELGAAALRDELCRSRELLGEKLGIESRMLALPGGDAPRSALLGEIGEAGYRVVATSRWGVNADRRAESVQWIRRCTVRGEPGDREFLAIATGDPVLRLRKHAREGTLAFIRRSLGPSRYARWRRGVLDAAGSLVS